MVGITQFILGKKKMEVMEEGREGRKERGRERGEDRGGMEKRTLHR